MYGCTSPTQLILAYNANVFQMSPCAVGYESILLADQTYEDHGHRSQPASSRSKSRSRTSPRKQQQQSDVSALCQHFLAAYNIRPDFFCKFQGRPATQFSRTSGKLLSYFRQYFFINTYKASGCRCLLFARIERPVKKLVKIANERFGRKNPNVGKSFFFNDLTNDGLYLLVNVSSLKLKILFAILLFTTISTKWKRS